MSVEGVKGVLEGTLNESVLTPNSIYGIVIIVVIAYLIIHGIRKVTSSIGSIIGFILLIEIGHIAAFYSSVGIWAPVLKEIFKYDVFTALAQLCVGTPIADALLYTQAWLIAVMDRVVSFITSILGIWTGYARNAIR
jgi:hypothetical protein